jgi:hypothetical protein
MPTRLGETRCHACTDVSKMMRARIRCDNNNRSRMCLDFLSACGDSERPLRGLTAGEDYYVEANRRIRRRSGCADTEWGFCRRRDFLGAWGGGLRQGQRLCRRGERPLRPLLQSGRNHSIGRDADHGRRRGRLSGLDLSQFYYRGVHATPGSVHARAALLHHPPVQEVGRAAQRRPGRLHAVRDRRRLAG